MWFGSTPMIDPQDQAMAYYIAAVYGVPNYLGNTREIPAGDLAAVQQKVDELWAASGQDLNKFKSVVASLPGVPAVVQPKTGVNTTVIVLGVLAVSLVAGMLLFTGRR